MEKGEAEMKFCSQISERILIQCVENGIEARSALLKSWDSQLLYLQSMVLSQNPCAKNSQWSSFRLHTLKPSLRHSPAVSFLSPLPVDNLREIPKILNYAQQIQIFPQLPKARERHHRSVSTPKGLPFRLVRPAIDKKSPSSLNKKSKANKNGKCMDMGQERSQPKMGSFLLLQWQIHAGWDRRNIRVQLAFLQQKLPIDCQIRSPLFGESKNYKMYSKIQETVLQRLSMAFTSGNKQKMERIWHDMASMVMQYQLINITALRQKYKLQLKSMRRTESQVMRNNHHSLHRKQSPLSLHSSKTDSVAKPRKMSTASLKENIPDLDKLIMDIKITPMPDSNTQNIKGIYRGLKELESNPLVFDQVHAVYLLMQSIENKLNTNNRMKYRPPGKLSIKRDSTGSESKELSEVSPIKQISSEETSSRILYTNLSLKDIERSISEESSLKMSDKISGPKVAVSKFQECESNSEMEKLNDEIKYLEKLLATKTKGAGSTADLALFKKKSCRY